MKTNRLFFPCIIAMNLAMCSCALRENNVKEVVVELADSTKKKVGDTICLDDINVYLNNGSGLKLVESKDFSAKRLKGYLKTPEQKNINLTYENTTLLEEGTYNIEVTYNPESNYLFPCTGSTSFEVVDKFVPATSLSLASDSMAIFIDGSENIDYTVRPMDTTSTVSFESSDAKVAEVSSDGVVTGVGEGQCIIKASVDGLIRECLVTVCPYNTVNYVFRNNIFDTENGPWIYSEAGNIKQSGGISVSNETTITSPISFKDITKIEYSCPGSANEVDVDTGEISIFVADELVGTDVVKSSSQVSSTKYDVDSKTGYVSLNIKPNLVNKTDVLIKSVSVTYNAGPIYPTSISLKENVSLPVNCQDKLTISYTPVAANQRIIEWSSSNEDILTVDRDGTIYAHKEGESSVTATAKVEDGYISNSVTVSVYKIPVEYIDLEESEIDLYETKSKTIRYNVLPEEATYKGVTFESSNPKIATVDATGNVTGMVAGECKVYVKSIDDPTVVSECKVVVQERPPVYASTMTSVMTDFTENSYLNIDSAPSLNKTKFLVIPVWFKDSDKYISSKDTVRDDMNKAFFGTPSETGWHSVKSFYETESGGRLAIKGTVSDWYQVNYRHNEYDYETSLDSNKTVQLVKNATNWYFSNHSDNRRNYDCDEDGYLDGVILIYGCPDVEALIKDDRYVIHGDNLWAYTSWISEKSNCNKNKPGVNSYLWASYDFMYSETTAKKRTALSSYSGGNSTNALIDTHTYIHETGHIFGLEDYYDYANNQKYQYKPAGGFSMQDYNVGGHDPFSCLTLGWADAYIPFEDCEITLTPFQSSHQVIILSPSFNAFSSPFDEYLILELYTPTGLNEFDCKYRYKEQYPLGVNQTGIRLWHVDARLVSVSNKYNYAYSEDYFTVPFKNNDFMMSNTRYTNQTASYASPLGSDYSNYKLLQLIRNNSEETYKSESFFNESDLYQDGSTFKISDVNKQFVNKNRFNSGKMFDWNFSVSIKGSNENAIATISFIKIN